MNYQQKIEGFISSRMKGFGDLLFSSKYVSKDNPQRFELIRELEAAYPGFSDFAVANSDLTDENIHKQNTNKLTSLANSYFSSLADEKYASLAEVEPISQEFMDKYHEIIMVDELDDKGELVYDEIDQAVMDEYGENVGSFKLKVPRKSQRLILSALDEEQFLGMVNDLTQEIVERSVGAIPSSEDSLSTGKSGKISNDEIDRKVFEKIQELVSTGKLEYTAGTETKTIDFGRDVNRLITRGSLSSEFETTLAKFIEQLGVRKEIQPIIKTHIAMVGGVQTPVNQTLEFSKYTFNGNNPAMTSFNGLAKALTVTTGGKNPDGSDAQLAPLWIDNLRKSYNKEVDSWLTKNNISTFDIDAKAKFLAFFNEQVQKVSGALKSECKDIRTLAHLQDWSYNILPDPNFKPEIQPTRIEQAMNDAYYKDKASHYNTVNANSNTQVEGNSVAPAPLLPPTYTPAPVQQQLETTHYGHSNTPSVHQDPNVSSALDEIYGNL
jgi:hypothetical protein